MRSRALAAKVIKVEVAQLWPHPSICYVWEYRTGDNFILLETGPGMSNLDKGSVHKLISLLSFLFCFGRLYPHRIIVYTSKSCVSLW